MHRHILVLLNEMLMCSLLSWERGKGTCVFLVPSRLFRNEDIFSDMFSSLTPFPILSLSHSVQLRNSVAQKRCPKPWNKYPQLAGRSKLWNPLDIPAYCRIEMIQEIGLSFTAKWEMGYRWKISQEYMTRAQIGCWTLQERNYMCALDCSMTTFQI